MSAHIAMRLVWFDYSALLCFAQEIWLRPPSAFREVDMRLVQCSALVYDVHDQVSAFEGGDQDKEGSYRKVSTRLVKSLGIDHSIVPRHIESSPSISRVLPPANCYGRTRRAFSSKVSGPGPGNDHARGHASLEILSSGLTFSVRTLPLIFTTIQSQPLSKCLPPKRL